MEGNGWVQI